MPFDEPSGIAVRTAVSVGLLSFTLCATVPASPNRSAQQAARG